MTSSDLFNEQLNRIHDLHASYTKDTGKEPNYLLMGVVELQVILDYVHDMTKDLPPLCMQAEMCRMTRFANMGVLPVNALACLQPVYVSVSEGDRWWVSPGANKKGGE